MSHKASKTDEIISFSNKKINYLEYLDVILQNLPPNEIDEVFKFKNFLMNVRHLSEKQANYMLFKQFATPQNVPAEVWFSFDDVAEKTDFDDEEFDPSLDYEYGEYSDDDGYIGDSFQSIDKANLASSTKITKIGGTFELWTAERYKFACASPAEELSLSDLLNSIELSPYNKIQEMMNQTTYIYFKRIGLKEIQHNIPLDTDALVMDPPLGKNGFTLKEFSEICVFLKTLKRAFIFIWAEPADFSIINHACNYGNLLFCDTITVELLDEQINPYKIVGKRSFVNTTKTIMIFKTAELKRDLFVHQKSKDIAYGIIRPNGKSRGRLGTPPIAHEVAEKMLPSEKTKRIFVEIWPTRMSPRPNWIFLDEK